MQPMLKKTLVSVLVAGLSLPAITLAEEDLNSQISALTKQINVLEKKLEKVAAQAKQSSKKKAENFTDAEGEDVFQTASVTTSPTLGLRSAHHGLDLMVNFSSLNEDVRLLTQRAAFAKQRGLEELSRPLVEVSGAIRGSSTYEKNFSGHSTVNTDLADAELDIFVEGSNWVSGFLSLAYDAGKPGYSAESSDPKHGYNTVSWSNIYLKRGFVTLGDFNKSPFYASIGQMYMPFGRYSTWLVSSPLTKLVGRTHGRAINVGYKGDDFVAAGFIMHSDSKEVSDGTFDGINAWGGNVEKQVQLNAANKLTVGLGYSNNLADSEGSLKLLGYVTQSLEGSASYDVEHYVPAYDVYAKFELGDSWIVNAEYLAATNNMKSELLGFDFGKPGVYHVELDHFAFVGKLPLSMGIGYGHTSDFIYAPKRSYQIALSTFLWKDTVQSIEYRHLTAYDGSDADSIAFSRDYVTALFSMYF